MKMYRIIGIWIFPDEPFNISNVCSFSKEGRQIEFFWYRVIIDFVVVDWQLFILIILGIDNIHFDVRIFMSDPFNHVNN